MKRVCNRNGAPPGVDREWANWSGSVRFTPGRVVEPRDEDELAKTIRRASAANETVRVVGAGHSSSPLVQTNDILISLARFQGVEVHEQESGVATIGAGVTLDEAGKALLRHGLAFQNLGDIDYQTVAGALATGTHGTGCKLPNLAVHLVGGRLLTGMGEIVSFAEDQDPVNIVIDAARVSLGVVGIMTALRLRLVPAYRVRKRVWCTRADACLAHFDDLAANHRHVDFYWYPRSDETKIRVTDPVDTAPRDLPFARLQSEEIGWSNEVIANVRELRFEEMEYALPAETGITCFREVRERIKSVWRRIVGWRVLYRTVAADDAYLSPAHGRATVTISLHQNATLPYEEFFNAIEPIFRSFDGRPHWGKKHSLRADDLRPHYPRWGRFLEVRQQFDPDGVFLNDYLRELLGVDVGRRDIPGGR